MNINKQLIMSNGGYARSEQGLVKQQAMLKSIN